MLQYKQNLEVLNSRYTDTERQLLKVYAKILRPAEISANERGESIISSFLEVPDTWTYGDQGVAVPAGMEWLLSNLLDDGIVDLIPQIAYRSALEFEYDRSRYTVSLTRKGVEMVSRLVAAEPI